MILYVVCSTFCNASSSWMLMWYCEHFYATPMSKKIIHSRFKDMNQILETTDMLFNSP